jgi:hypothetical protein
MVDLLDGAWWAVVLLGFLALFVAGWSLWLREDEAVGEGPAVADDEEPDARTLGDWRNEYEEREGGGGWMECFCCGCPVLDGDEDFAVCEVCGWDGDVERMEAARASFQREGYACTTQEAAELGLAHPSAAERACALELAALCAAVPEGEKPLPSFWTAFYDRLEALRRLREEPAARGG